MEKITKIKSTLVSAYACEPSKGSEPGVGWNWVLELAKQGYDVHVITRANNKLNIENELKTLEPLSNLNFYYYDLPKFIRLLKKMPFGIYIYYFFWQIGIVGKAKKIIKINQIDIIHHLTFGVFRQASFLHTLNKPFIFGPVGGAETAPKKLLKSLPKVEYLKEVLRNLINSIYKRSPLLNRMYENSSLILCKTTETYNFLPSKYNFKKKIQIEIGINNNQEVQTKYPNKSDTTLNVLYVGRFVGWKGVYIAIDAIKKTTRAESDINFTMIGKGKIKSKLVELSKGCKVDFIDWVSQKELFNYYSSFDCLLFPSMHDSSGNVILESLSFGLPVICLNLGGPKELVNNKCGYIINVEHKDSDEISQQIADVLINLKNNKKRLSNLRIESKKKAMESTWKNVVTKTYNTISKSLE